MLVSSQHSTITATLAVLLLVLALSATLSNAQADLSLALEEFPPVPTEREDILAMVSKLQNDYEGTPVPISEMANTLPLPPDDYPEPLKGVLWMDQWGYYGYQNLSSRAYENLLTFGDTHLSTLDPETHSLWTAGACGGAWSIDGTPRGKNVQRACRKLARIFQFVFSQDYTVGEFHLYNNGTLEPPETLGYRGTMVLVPPESQTPDVCPPPEDATPQERNLCAKWIRVSYSTKPNRTRPVVYPVFEIMGQDGVPIEPYYSAFVESISTERANGTTQLYNRLKPQVGVTSVTVMDIDTDLLNDNDNNVDSEGTAMEEEEAEEEEVEEEKPAEPQEEEEIPTSTATSTSITVLDVDTDLDVDSKDIVEEAEEEEAATSMAASRMHYSGAISVLLLLLFGVSVLLL